MGEVYARNDSRLGRVGGSDEALPDGSVEQRHPFGRDQDTRDCVDSSRFVSSDSTAPQQSGSQFIIVDCLLSFLPRE